MNRSHLKLGMFLFLPGHHLAGWRLPGADPAGSANLSAYKTIAAICEQAKLDMLFIGDTLALPDMASETLGRTSRAEAPDPLLILSALAAITDRIGLVATTTTTYTRPYLVARQFATLDHLSGGRAGWNVVTSSNRNEAANFGADGHPDHDHRYERAGDFIVAVKALWDSWEDGAFIRDKSTGQFFDPGKVRAIHHRSAHFSVEGPLTLGRPPQGHPVIVQAGSSEPGKDIGARTADVIFTAQPTVEAARDFRADITARLAARGRSAESVVVMPGLMPILGRTQAEADTLAHDLDALVDDQVGLSLLGEVSGGTDFSQFDLDGSFPGHLTSNGGKSRLDLLGSLAHRENLTIRQLLRRVARGRGHLVVKGTVKDVADRMEAWFKAGAADGFNIMPPAFDDAFNERLLELAAELASRNLFRKEYNSATLRGHLGLARP